MLEKRKNPVLDKLARALLASSCLAGAAGIARADTIITEGIAPAPSLFPTTFPGYLLPVGTTSVVGSVTGCVESCEGEDINRFEFQGLLPGSTFHIGDSFEGSSLGSYAVFDTSVDFFGTCSFDAEECGVTGVVPLDGNLVISAGTECGVCGAQDYQIDLDAPLAGAPEPSTLATAGLALAGALAWRRRRSRIG